MVTRIAEADPPGARVIQDGRTKAVGPLRTAGTMDTAKHSVMVVQGLLVMTMFAVTLLCPLGRVRLDGLAEMVELGEHGVIGVVTGTADIFWTSRVRPSTQLVLAKGGNEGTGHSGEKSNASEEYSATTSRLATVVCRMTNPLKAWRGGC